MVNVAVEPDKDPENHEGMPEGLYKLAWITVTGTFCWYQSSVAIATATPGAGDLDGLSQVG